MLFRKRKKYVFDKETYLKRDKFNMKIYERLKEHECFIQNWVDFCDGKLVDVIDNRNGEIKYNNISFSINHNWCKEVKE